MTESDGIHQKLFLAAEHGDLQAIETLLRQGADPFRKNANFLDAIDISLQQQGEDFFNRFLALIARLDSENSPNAFIATSPLKKRRETAGLPRDFSKEIHFLEKFYTYFEYERSSRTTTLSDRRGGEAREEDLEDFSDSFEDAQQFGREAYVTADPDITFTRSMVALRPDIVLSDVFDECLAHFEEFPKDLKSVVIQWLFALGGDGSLFARLNDETRREMELVSGIVDNEGLYQYVQEFAEAIDPSATALYEYIVLDQHISSTSIAEFTVASFIKILMVIDGSIQPSD